MSFEAIVEDARRTSNDHNGSPLGELKFSRWQNSMQRVKYTSNKLSEKNNYIRNTNGPAHEILVYYVLATNEGSGMPVHLQSLATAYTQIMVA